MTDTTENGSEAGAKPRRNWWKVAFIIAFFAFELTREIAVIESAKGAQPNTFARLFAYDGYVRAEGSWRRIDGGQALLPGTVTIECRRNTGRCLEASVSVIEQYVFAPDIDWFDAQFSPDTVSYENDRPDCANYSVRLDLKIQKVFAVRNRKENPTNPNCANLEKRIEMQLGDGFEPSQTALDGHFVPIISTLAFVGERL